MAPDTPVSSLRGVGPALAERLGRLGVHTTQDLLLHLPLRYEDRTRLTPIGSLQDGQRLQVQGQVAAADISFGRRRTLLVRISDNTGLLTLRFFHFGRSQQQQLSRGTWVRCFGDVRRVGSSMEIVHPEYRVLADNLPATDEALTPVYPTTDGLGQARIRQLVAQALAQLAEHEPEAVASSRKPWTDDDPVAGAWPSLAAALALVHRPPPGSNLQALEERRHPAVLRLACEELLAHHLAMRTLRRRARQHPAPAMPLPQEPNNSGQALLNGLGFTLTGAQKRVVQEVGQDLARSQPMLRLVQGDVGSGKTIVAAMAALHAIDAGWQVALMAPTELLAEQHADNFRQWLRPLQLTPVLLTGRHRGANRQNRLDALANGTTMLAIGTHALFQDDVRFQRLGLVIVDEQHRFGVHQRLALREKAGDTSGQPLRPHQLVMTATPIPRTLAQTAYADLDVSVIDELPKGRQPVTTVAMPEERRPDVVARVANACSEGRQAYWICTLVEESESLAAHAAEDTAEDLAAALPNLRIGLVHGRLKASDKQAQMEKFSAGLLDLLVATTVVEVGVDVPNASLMVIENAERLGLAQLHQLRGRVGRGSIASHCVLMYHPPLSQHGRARLQVLRETSDGFRIAERDLELRGPGEVLGTRQTGDLSFRIADLTAHQDLIPTVQRLATRLEQEHPDQAQVIRQRWLPERNRYADV